MPNLTRRAGGYSFRSRESRLSEYKCPHRPVWAFVLELFANFPENGSIAPLQNDLQGKYAALLLKLIRRAVFPAKGIYAARTRGTAYSAVLWRTAENSQNYRTWE